MTISNRVGSPWSAPACCRLPGRRRERRQLAYVPRVVLDDHGGLEIRRELLEAIERSQRLRAVGVEPGHAVRFVVFVKMREIARKENIAFLLQLDEQAVVTWRMPGRVQHQDRPVAEHVLVR